MTSQIVQRNEDEAGNIVAWWLERRIAAESICGLTLTWQIYLERRAPNILIMTLRTGTLAETNYLSNTSSARVLHASPSLPDIYYTGTRAQRSRRINPPMSPATLSSVDLQLHIYNSLLESRTADVALHVRGTWEAIYKLHRVVLIQSVRPATDRALHPSLITTCRASLAHYSLLDSLSPHLNSLAIYRDLKKLM